MYIHVHEGCSQPRELWFSDILMSSGYLALILTESSRSNNSLQLGKERMYLESHIGMDNIRTGRILEDSFAIFSGCRVFLRSIVAQPTFASVCSFVNFPNFRVEFRTGVLQNVIGSLKQLRFPPLC